MKKKIKKNQIKTQKLFELKAFKTLNSFSKARLDFNSNSISFFFIYIIDELN